MKSAIISFVVGIIFAIGLGISGMTLPAKVIGFLDFFGDWDPSLVFVMGGAVVVYFLLFRVGRGEKPVFASRFSLPSAKKVDGRLVVGAALFGVGWGLAGYCPGPALTSLGCGALAPVIFVAAMVAGMLSFSVFVTSRS